MRCARALRFGVGFEAVACSRCERRGRYRLDGLIARHGADTPVRVIVPRLTARNGNPLR